VTLGQSHKEGETKMTQPFEIIPIPRCIDSGFRPGGDLREGEKGADPLHIDPQQPLL
jgi:hypothetical protein